MLTRWFISSRKRRGERRTLRKGGEGLRHPRGVCWEPFDRSGTSANLLTSIFFATRQKVGVEACAGLSGLHHGTRAAEEI